jgi:hypothetical protein
MYPNKPKAVIAQTLSTGSLRLAETFPDPKDWPPGIAAALTEMHMLDKGELVDIDCEKAAARLFGVRPEEASAESECRTVDDDRDMNHWQLWTKRKAAEPEWWAGAREETSGQGPALAAASLAASLRKTRHLPLGVPFVALKVNGQKTEALLDSGASYTLMRFDKLVDFCGSVMEAKRLMELAAKSAAVNDNVSHQACDGAMIGDMGQVVLPVEIGGKQVAIRFRVMTKLLTGVIIGGLLMKSWQALYDYTADTLWLKALPGHEGEFVKVSALFNAGDETAESPTLAGAAAVGAEVARRLWSTQPRLARWVREKR